MKAGMVMAVIEIGNADGQREQWYCGGNGMKKSAMILSTGCFMCIGIAATHMACSKSSKNKVNDLIIETDDAAAFWEQYKLAVEEEGVPPKTSKDPQQVYDGKLPTKITLRTLKNKCDFMMAPSYHIYRMAVMDAAKGVVLRKNVPIWGTSDANIFTTDDDGELLRIELVFSKPRNLAEAETRACMVQFSSGVNLDVIVNVINMLKSMGVTGFRFNMTDDMAKRSSDKDAG
jgi:hypothetical protein